MATKQELSAAEVYEIRTVPTARLGRITAMFYKVVSIFGGHPTPDDTYAVVFEKATGAKAIPVTGIGTFLIDQMQADLEKLSAVDFRNRYLGA